MSCMNKQVTIRAGSTFEDVAVLRIGGRQFEIPSTATVTASLLDSRKAELIAAQSSAEGGTGADWPRSVVSVLFASSDTSGIPDGAAFIRVSVTYVDTKVQLFDMPVRIDG